jgi:hypothetical protein
MLLDIVKNLVASFSAPDLILKSTCLPRKVQTIVACLHVITEWMYDAFELKY